jgi:hypothetical protein
LGGFLLGGCQLKPQAQTNQQNTANQQQTQQTAEENQQNTGNQQQVQQVQAPDQQAMAGNEEVDITADDIPMPVLLTTKIENPNLLQNVDKLQGDPNAVIVYMDPNCKSQPVCDTRSIQQALNFLGLSGVKVVYKDLPKDIDVYVPAIVIPGKFLQKSIDNPQVAQIVNNPQFFKKVGDYYITVVGNWENGKENLCNDGQDNDGDGKIDAQDPDCNQYFAVLYKNKDPQVEQLLNAYKDRLYGFVVTGIDANSELGKKVIDAIINAYKNKSFYQGQNTILQLQNCKYKYAILSKPIVKV